MAAGSEAILSQKVYDNPRHLMLLRAHVSRKAAGKGRAVLEGVGLAAEKIRLCYVNNPSNEEEAVQQGLMDWSSGQGMQPPTWTVLMGAMEHALIGIQHIRSLKADLGIDEERPPNPTQTPQQPETTQDKVDPLKEWPKVKQLGKGGFGEVLLCKNVNTGEQQAVKKVLFDPSNQQKAQSLKKEIKIFKSLRHDRIVTYFNAVEMNGVFYIFMEYMSGGSIQQLLHHGPLDEVLTQKYTRQILEGVAYLHIKEIVHRDIKGANVLLGSDGNAKLADFGVSKQLQTITTGLTTANTMKGTYNWMAPEVVNRRRFTVTTKADIWSVGCTVVEMLTGKPPLDGLELATLLFTIGSEPETFHSCLSLSCSDRVHYFLSQCFAVDPNARMSAVDLLSLPFLKNKHPGDDVRVPKDSDEETNQPPTPLQPQPIPDQEGPMSQWNIDALVSLQGKLKLYVKMNTGLMDRLQPAAGGFMSPAEEQRVKNQRGNYEQMGELIEILKGKRNKDFDTFLKMLRAVNYEVWADELMKEAEKFRRESVGVQPQPTPPALAGAAPVRHASGQGSAPVTPTPPNDPVLTSQQPPRVETGIAQRKRPPSQVAVPAPVRHASGQGSAPVTPNPPNDPVLTNQQPPHVVTAEQVLHQFQDRFIDEVDADSIAFDLKYKDIIPGGLVTAIRQRFESMQQNQLLYEHLEKACDKDALMTVCDIMISVKGHPKMNKLGKDMKSMLQGSPVRTSWT